MLLDIKPKVFEPSVKVIKIFLNLLDLTYKEIEHFMVWFIK